MLSAYSAQLCLEVKMRLSTKTRQLIWVTTLLAEYTRSYLDLLVCAVFQSKVVLIHAYSSW